MQPSPTSDTPTPAAVTLVATLPVTLTASEHNLIWIDMEMTGLDPDNDRIIEVAVVVTDPQITVRVEGPVLAVHQSEAALDRMDAWNRGTHGVSGRMELNFRTHGVELRRAGSGVLGGLWISPVDNSRA